MFLGMEGVLQQLKTALECPCCLNTPKPDTTSIGMCTSGHMTCQPCGDQVLQRSQSCPVCRTSNFQVVRGHKLAISMIQILTSFLIYTCRHDNCNQRLNGENIVRHEQQCLEKPVCCPKQTECAYKGPVYQFLNGLHARCVNVCPIREQSQLWNFVIDMTTFYSFDTCEVTISDRFKPIILRGTVGNFESHSYINLAKISGMAIVYIGWLNVKTHVDDRYQKARFALSVYINTRYGRVGQFVMKSPLFENERLDKYEDGIFLNKHCIFNWSDWGKDFKCPECSVRKGHPHVHVEVKKI